MSFGPEQLNLFGELVKSAPFVSLTLFAVIFMAGFAIASSVFPKAHGVWVAILKARRENKLRELFFRLKTADPLAVDTLRAMHEAKNGFLVIHIDNMEYGHVRLLEKLGLAGPLSGENFAYVLTPLGAELWNEVRGPISIVV